MLSFANVRCSDICFPKDFRISYDAFEWPKAIKSRSWRPLVLEWSSMWSAGALFMNFGVDIGVDIGFESIEKLLYLLIPNISCHQRMKEFVTLLGLLDRYTAAGEV